MIDNLIKKVSVSGKNGVANIFRGVSSGEYRLEFKPGMIGGKHPQSFVYGSEEFNEALTKAGELVGPPINTVTEFSSEKKTVPDFSRVDSGAAYDSLKQHYENKIAHQQMLNENLVAELALARNIHRSFVASFSHAVLSTAIVGGSLDDFCGAMEKSIAALEQIYGDALKM